MVKFLASIPLQAYCLGSGIVLSSSHDWAQWAGNTLAVLLILPMFVAPLALALRYRR